jgi:hypothetical protein
MISIYKKKVESPSTDKFKIGFGTESWFFDGVGMISKIDNNGVLMIYKY